MLYQLARFVSRKNKKVLLRERKRHTRDIPTLDGGTYPGRGGITLDRWYLPWKGIPTLTGGYLPWTWGYLTWLRGYLSWPGAPTLDGGTYPGWGVPQGNTHQEEWRYPLLGRMVVLPHQEGWGTPPQTGRIGVPLLGRMGYPIGQDGGTPHVDRQTERHMFSKHSLPLSFGIRVVKMNKLSDIK